MMQIGAYQIERELGRGGFGVVYVGVDTRLGRRAAIKQLLPDLSSNHAIVERFFNEAKAAASINHPGIVEIYDVGWHTDGSAYFAMKLLDGESLGRRVRSRGPLPIGHACTIARQVASALAAAHGSGIVHRDLKPDNIILVRDDEIAIGERAVVLDFGIAKLGGSANTSQTRTGVMMGTPNYMSPEQCKGAGEVDHRTDLYAIGCILFEMLTGRVPFVGEGPGEIMGMHQFVEPPALRSLRPDAPEALEGLISQLLAKKPEHRIQQMTALQTALQAFAVTVSREHPAAFGPTQPMPPVMPVDAGAQTALSETDQKKQSPVYVDPISVAARAANRPPLTAAPQQSTLSAASSESSPVPAKKSRVPIFVLGGVALVAAIVAGAVIAGGDGGSGSTGSTERGAGGSAASGSVASGSAASVGFGIADPTLRDKCERLRGEMNWNELARCATELAATDATLSANYAEIAKREIAAKRAYEDMQVALTANDLKAAKDALDKIPPASLYAEQAQTRYERSTPTAIATECTTLQSTKQWAALQDCGRRLAAAGDARGKQFQKLATDETAAEVAYNELVALLASKNINAASAALKKIPDTSAYRKAAKAAYDAYFVSNTAGGAATTAGSAVRGALRTGGRINISQSDFDAGMAKVTPAVNACYEGAPSKIHVKVNVVPSGKVDKVSVVGSFAGTAIAGCVEAAVRPARFPPWEGSDQLWSHSFPVGAQSSPAAQDPKKARAMELFEEGQRQYNVANFAKAIEKFTEAYAVLPDPTFLFNIAQAHRQAGDKPQAIFFYKRYLSQAPSSRNAELVRKLIVELGGTP